MPIREGKKVGIGGDPGAPRTGGLPTTLPPCVHLCELQVTALSEVASWMTSLTFNSQNFKMMLNDSYQENIIIQAQTT